MWIEWGEKYSNERAARWLWHITQSRVWRKGKIEQNGIVIARADERKVKFIFCVLFLFYCTLLSSYSSYIVCRFQTWYKMSTECEIEWYERFGVENIEKVRCCAVFPMRHKISSRSTCVDNAVTTWRVYLEPSSQVVAN